MITKNSSNSSRNQVQLISLDDLVPQDHILRKVDELIDFSFVYDYVDDLYSKTQGRPSEDPVRLIKLVFLQYFYGIKSMRATVKQVETDLAFRWFLGIGLKEKVMHYSTFFKNFERRFKGTDLFERIFYHSVELALEAGLINTDYLFIDGTHVKAHANVHKYSIEEKEEIVHYYEEALFKEIEEDRRARGKKALKKNKTNEERVEEKTEKRAKEETGNKEEISVEERLVENLKIEEYQKGLTDEEDIYEAANISEEERKVIEEKEIQAIIQQQKVYGEMPALDKAKEESAKGKKTKKRRLKSGKKVSTTDPESGLFYKDNFRRQFAYNNQAVCDVNGWILAASVSAGNIHDAIAFSTILDKISAYHPKIVVADNGYRSPVIAKSLLEQGIELLLPYKSPMTKEGFFKRSDYVYDENFDCIICPNDQTLRYTTTTRQGRRQYKSDPKICSVCPYLDKCTHSKNHTKLIERHIWQDYMEEAELTRYKRGYKQIYDLRKETIERDFGQAKEVHGYRYTNMTGKEKMEYKTFMTFFAMNIKKLVNVTFNAA